MTYVEVLEGDVLKAGDTQPTLKVQLYEEDEHKDITGFTCTLRVRNNKDETLILDETMSAVSERNGVVKYAWQAGDTDVAGLHDAEVSITDGTDTITYPNDGYFQIDINETLE
jgi:L-ascorbate metabolism protein UlaG (beta-lactamase superfamily)